MNIVMALYSSIIYLPLSILLVICMLYVPALAFMPRLIQRPLLFSAVPILSYFLLGCISFLLRIGHVFNHEVVLWLTIALCFIALIRLVYLLRTESLAWHRSDVAILLFNFAWVIPLIFLAFYSAFTVDDALASWNYWAKLYFFCQSTGQNLYPTLYPSFLSYCYQFLGSIAPQGVVKVLLVFFIFSILNAIAFSSKKTSRGFILYFVLVLLILFPGNRFVNLYHFYVIGYADPILAAVIAVSCAMALEYVKTNNILAFFALLLSAIAAAWTKQPGLVWAGLVVPALFFAKIIQRKAIWWVMVIAIVLLLLAVFGWLAEIPKNFYQQSGVVATSQVHFSTNNQVMPLYAVCFHSIYYYLCRQPTLLFIFILAFLSVRQGVYQRIIVVGQLLIGLILWFIFASYDIREGLYLIAIAGVLIAQQDFFIDWFNQYLPWINKVNQVIYQNGRLLLSLFLIIAVFLGMLLSFLQLDRMKGGIFPMHGGKTDIYYYFLDQPQWVYKNVYLDKTAVVAGATNYEHGLFFGQKDIINLYAKTATNMLAVLKQNQVKFILISRIVSPVQYHALTVLSAHCNAVEKKELGTARYFYEIYEIDINKLNQCRY